MHEVTIQIARDACSFPNMATGLHTAVSSFNAPDSALTCVIPAATKTVSINWQLLCGVQVSDDQFQPSEPQAAQNRVAESPVVCMFKH